MFKTGVWRNASDTAVTIDGRECGKKENNGELLSSIKTGLEVVGRSLMKKEG